jgi:hypothetical protein
MADALLTILAAGNLNSSLKGNKTAAFLSEFSPVFETPELSTFSISIPPWHHPGPLPQKGP